MIPSRSLISCAGGGLVWTIAVGLGVCRLWNYETTPGDPANAPIRWPSQSSVHRTNQLPSLVLMVHPKCPCSRATIGELAKLMAHCQGRLNATVLVLRPGNLPAGWERTDIWDSAAAIHGVTVLTDIDGIESRRFGGATSGQALLFAPDARLLFSGGITESRGHSGDNAGRTLIESLVLGQSIPASSAHTEVYGCPLFDPSSSCQVEGSSACPSK